ncbi:hypothetical protein ACFLWM_02615 [Chloroflexota bacterium]
MSKLRPVLGEHFTLGECFAGDALFLGKWIEKKWTGGYQVKAAAQVFTELWVFQKGAVLGVAKADKKKALARLVAPNSEEKKVLEFFRAYTEQSLKDYGREPSSFRNFFFSIRFPRMDFGDMRTYKFLNKKKYRLGEVLPHFTKDAIQGISFGVTKPQLVKKMWEESYETKEDQTMWEEARRHGIDLPEQQTILPWKEMEDIVLAQVLEYAKENDPDVIPLLGLE